MSYFVANFHSIIISLNLIDEIDANKENNSLYNTNKYISMYPCNSSSNFNYVDLNYLKIPSTSNVKRLSQIDKFNMRYKK